MATTSAPTSKPTPSRRSSVELASSLYPPRASFSSSRTSVLSYLRRDEMPVHHKTPLLTLKLSSPSFLDSAITDDITRQSLYAISTSGTSTTVMRSDPWEGLTTSAEIRWPRVLPAKGKARDSDGVLVQMRGGRWIGGESLLRPGSLLRYLLFGSFAS